MVNPNIKGELCLPGTWSHKRNSKLNNIMSAFERQNDYIFDATVH